MNNDHADQLLDQLATEFSRGETCYRNHLLLCGRMCQDYILSRKQAGASRAAAVQSITGRLAEASGKTVKVNLLVGTAQAVDLLAGDVDYSAVPFRVLRELVALLKRDTKTEAWSIRPGLEQGARDLFRHLVAARLDAEGVKLRVRELLGKEKPPRGAKGEDDDLLAYLVNADPRDAADMLAEVFRQHKSPDKLATALALAMLEVGAHGALNGMVLVARQRARQHVA